MGGVWEGVWEGPEGRSEGPEGRSGVPRVDPRCPRVDPRVPEDPREGYELKGRIPVKPGSDRSMWQLSIVGAYFSDECCPEGITFDGIDHFLT